jgi:hypothetical protein
MMRGHARPLCAALLLLFAGSLSAQSLVGNWVSTEPLLQDLKFVLTFREADYEINCSLGQTIGTWWATGDTIHFTPTKIGINSGDAGKNDTWQYSFVNDDSFFLSSGPIKVRLVRKPE